MHVSLHIWLLYGLVRPPATACTAAGIVDADIMHMQEQVIAWTEAYAFVACSPSSILEAYGNSVSPSLEGPGAVITFVLVYFKCIQVAERSVKPLQQGLAHACILALPAVCNQRLAVFNCAPASRILLIGGVQCIGGQASFLTVA